MLLVHDIMLKSNELHSADALSSYKVIRNGFFESWTHVQITQKSK